MKNIKNEIKNERLPKSPLRGVGGLAVFWALVFSFWWGQNLNAQAAGTPYPTPKGCTNVATQGQDFWVTFGNNYNVPANQVYLALQIANGNSSPVTITLTFTATGQSASYTVPANTSKQADLSYVTPAGGTTGDSLGDMRQYIYHSGTNSSVSDTTLHITSNAIVSVVAFNTQSMTTDATILLPSTVWGQDYYNFSYQGASLPNGTTFQNVHMIIANQNNTHVTITDYDGSTVATATLNAGQVYYGVGTGAQDLTGINITTDKPVAYFMHNSGARVMANVVAIDILFQQLMPVPRYGQYFLLPNETQFNTIVWFNNLVRIKATQDGTVVNFTNALAFTDAGYTQGNGYVSAGTNGSSVSSLMLNKGQWTTVQIAGGQDSYCTIAATQPIGVVQYMQGGGGGNNPMDTLPNELGDPAICHISSVSNLINTVIIAPFIPVGTDNSGIFPRGGSSTLGLVFVHITPRHYALITAPTASKDNVIISRNGVSLGTLTQAANAASQNITDPKNSSPNFTGGNIISAPTAWVDVPTPLNGVYYSYIRYDFNYLTDATASFRITNPSGGVLVTQVGIGYYESYTFNSGNGGCLISY